MDLRDPDDVLGGLRVARRPLPRLLDGKLLNNDALPEGFSRLGYELTVFVPVGVTLAVGVIFYILGRRTREEAVDVPQGAEPATM